MEEKRMSEYPTVSIIMAVKNRPEAFENSLISWSKLEYDNDYELIVVDDGSDDGELIKEISTYFTPEMLPNLQYYRLESKRDRVPNIAWNFGMEKAKNDFIIVTNGDLIISHKTVLKHILDGYKGYRISVLTYFLSIVQTALLETIVWEYDPTKIEDLVGFWTVNKLRKAAGLTTYLTGQYRKDWEWFGGFRNEEGFSLSDLDIHIRERKLKLGCETAPVVRAYHQYHEIVDFPMDEGYTYETEEQARLI